MIDEVDSATGFIARVLCKTRLDNDRLETFKEMLQLLMVNHYQNHWFPEKPFKGSGYRCLRIVNQKMDPLIAKAGTMIGLTELDLLNLLPREFTMWVDPNEVSYRIGEEGSIGVLYGPDADTASEDSDDSNRSSPAIVISHPQGNSISLHQLTSCSQESSRPSASSPSAPSQDNSWDYAAHMTYVAS